MADGVFLEAGSRTAGVAEAGCRTPDNGWAPRSVGPRSAAATVLRPPASVRKFSTFIPSHFSTLRAPRGAAFSLTEVVIALGIFAVSMVGVLALFPVASSTGQESSEETQAAILAQMIFDEIRDSADIRNAGNAYTLAGPNTVRTVHWQTVSLTNRTNYQVAYDVKRRDETTSTSDGPGMMGDPIALKALFTNVTTNAFSNGLAGANYLAQLQVFPINQRARLTQLTLRIDTPGNLPATNRRSFYFTTRISGR